MFCILWFLFCILLRIGFVRSTCTAFGKEYDAEEYAFLCKSNVTIPETIVKEILVLNPAAVNDPAYFEYLAQEVLNGLMSTFREEVANIYLQETCKNNICHPQLLEERRPYVSENIPRLLEISGIDLIDYINLPEDVSDLAIIPAFNDGFYLTIAYYSQPFLTLLRYDQNNLNYITDLMDHSGNCLATTSKLWSPSMIIVTSCVNKLKIPHFEPQTQYRANITTPIYTFIITSNGLELSQAIEIKDSPVTAIGVYPNVDTPALLTLTESGLGYHYFWNDYEFDLSATASLPPASHIRSFRIDRDVYIIFSNFLPLNGFESKGAHVYRNQRRKPDRFILFQRLGNCKALSSEYFTIANLHFVAKTCSDENKAYIYWWARNQFLLLQTIPTEKAVSWTSMRLINGEITLALLEYPFDTPTIRFFQYEDNYFWPVNQKIILQKHLSHHQLKIVSVNYQNDTLLFVNGRLLEQNIPETHEQPITFRHRTPSQQLPMIIANEFPSLIYGDYNYKSLNTLSVFKVNVMSRPIQPSFITEQDNVIPCINEVKHLLNQEQTLIAMIDVPTWDTMLTDKRQTILGEKILIHGLHSEEVFVENLALDPTINLLPADDFECRECEEIEREVNHKLSHLYGEMDDLVLTNRPEIIIGKKVLTKNIVVQEEVHVQDVVTGPVCNIDLKELSETSLRKIGDQDLNVTVMHAHFVTADIDIIGLVNGVDLRNVATLQGSRHFTAQQTFSHVNVFNVELTGKINEINPRHIVVNDLPQEIYGEKIIIGNLIVEGEINIRNTFNKINFTELVRNILRTDTQQTITHNVIFEKLNVKRIQAGSFKGRNLQKFYHSVLNTHKPQAIQSLTTFVSDINILHSMNVKQINNYFLSEFLTTNTFQHIVKPISINGKVTVHGALAVDFGINDLDWPYDIVTIGGRQTITGRKTFRQPQLTVSGSISMSPGSLVNSADLSELGYPKGILRRNIYVNDLTVNNINGQSVHKLLLLLKHSGLQTINAKFTFTNVELNDIYVRGLITNHTLQYDYVTVNTEQIIDEEVTFSRRVEIVTLNMKNGILINGKDLAKIHSMAVHVDGEHIVWGHKTFRKDVNVKNDVLLEPGVKLNNIDISEQLFITNKQQVVVGHFEIKEVTVNKNLKVIGNVKTRLMNRIRMEEFLDNIVYIQGEYIVRGVKNFHSNVVVYHQLNVHLINNFDINKFQKNIVRLSTEQNITGHLIFRDKLYLNSFSHVTNVNRKVLKLEGSNLANKKNNRVHTAVEFQDCVTFKKNINVAIMNNLNLHRFYANILSKSKPQNLSYTRQIIDSVKIDNLIVSKLDEIFIKDVINLKEDNTLIFPVVFHQKVDIISDIFLGTINNIRLEELQKETVIKADYIVLHGRKTFKEIEAREVIVDKLVNGVNVTDLPNRLVQIHKNQRITGSVTFQRGLTLNTLESKVPINGIDLNQMKKNVVLKNTKQTIVGKKKFIAPHRHNIRIHNNVEIEGSITRVKLIHGLDLVAVKNEVLINDIEQVFIEPITFRNDVAFNDEVIVLGTTNNVRFPNDLVKVNDSQDIRGSVIFVSTEIKDIHITNFINTINLTHLINHRLTLNTVQVINRPFVFEESVTITGDVIANQKLNQLTCNDIVTIDSEQEIIGPKTFIEVTAINVETDFINNFHWLILYNRIYQTHKRDWVHHEEIVFSKHIILKGPLESELQAVKNTNRLLHEAKSLTDFSIEKMINFDEWLSRSKHCTNEITPQVENLVHYLDYLNPMLRIESAIDIAIVPFDKEFYLLLVIDPITLPSTLQCHNMKILNCSNVTNAKTCYLTRYTSSTAKMPLENLPIQMTRKIDVVYGKNISFIVIWNTDSHCSPNKGGVHLFGLIGTNQLFRIAIFKEAMVLAILPGYTDSLFAVASSTSGVIDVSHIKCNYSQGCILGPILSQVSLYEGKPLKIHWFFYNKKPHLLIINAFNSSSGSNRVPSFIYEWNKKELVRKHVFFTVAPTDAIPFTINEISYLAIGSYDCINNMDSDRLRIYQLSSKEVKIIQEIPISTKSLSVVHYLNETYLAVAKQDADVYLYKWQGFFGFQFWSKVLINNPQNLNWYLDSKDILYSTISGNGSLLITGKLAGPIYRKINVAQTN